MTDYFDELNCTPVAPEDTANHQFILIARFMQQNGFLSEEFRREQLAPPASKELVRDLKEKKVSPGDERCAICLKPNEETESAVFKILPCSHEFHDTCILPWLEKTNSCPLCRFEMKTDDDDYEQHKKFQERARQREQDIDDLHNSMYG